MLTPSGALNEEGVQTFLIRFAQPKGSGCGPSSGPMGWPLFRQSTQAFQGPRELWN